MKLMIIILSILLIVSTSYSERDYVEISEDSHIVVTIDETNVPIVTETTDIVPYEDEPDWSCNLRMQVGGLAMGDLDGDGNLDLAVGCYHSQSYPPYEDWRNFILYNIDGELQTTPTWWSDDSSSTTDVRIADFNNDGFPDIFAANGDFGLQPSVIYYYSENDSVSTFPGWFADDNTWTTCAAPFDFDQDGDIDVATSNQGVSPDPYRPVEIFINNDGELETTPSWSTPAEEISGYLSWGDYDNDGWYDLGVSKWANFSSCVYKNNNGTVYYSPIFTVNTTDMQKGIGWSDVNGDGYPELAIGASSYPTSIYANNEGFLIRDPYWQSDNQFHGCQDLAWADIDGDGDEDLATVHFSTGHLRIYLNIDGEINPIPSWQYDATQVGTAVTFGDINGDGALDLVMGVSGEPCVMVFYNNNATVINERGNRPIRTKLLKNYPNPFNIQTRISFYLEKQSRINLTVYNISGKYITTLAHGDFGVGLHDVIWNGLDSNGKQTASGVYFYRFKTNSGIFTERMTLVK